MNLWPRFRSWLRATVWRSRTDAEMGEELRFHMEAYADDLVRKGVDRQEAVRRARIEFGGVDSAKEECREARRANILEAFFQDVHFGARVLRKNPSFTVVAVFTLALGIGANTAMFSIADTVLWRALPFPHPEQLVVAGEVNAKDPDESWGATYPTFRDWQSRSTAIAPFAAILSDSRILLRPSADPVRVSGAAVTHDYFEVMGVSPMMGRVISASDDTAGADPVVVLSHRMWAEQFGGDPAVIGKVVPIGRTITFTAIGVMPASFDDGTTEYWIPLVRVIPSNFQMRRSVWVLTTVGRLRPGRTMVEAQAELETITQQVRHDFPESNRGLVVSVGSLRSHLTGDLRPALLVLLGAVGIVLLIACANLAALISVRAAGRGRELAVRTALGASRGRLIAQLLNESVLLSFLGGAVGVALAFWATRSVALLSKDPRLLTATINLPVLLFALAASVATSLLSGIAPALHGARETFHSRAGGHRRRARLHQSLVVSEVALSLVLLVGAGLLFRSLRNIFEVSPGFRADHLITMRLALPSTYTADPQILRFYQSLQERLQLLPGVTGASVVSTLPISGGDGKGDISIEGRPYEPGAYGAASFRRALPNYFRVMGIPLLRGREFDDRDDDTRPQAVIINERMARRFWPDEDPIGKRIKIGPPDGNPWMTVVGVVKDVHQTGLDSDVDYSTYQPLAQDVPNGVEVAVRTAGDSVSAFSEVRGELHRIEPAMLVDHVMTMEARIEESVTPRKLNLFLFGLFSGLALVLASIGLYGVIAYSVGQRTREFGIRIALGARRADIMRLVLKQGLKLAIVGAGIGIAFALVLARALAQLLFGVRPADPVTIVSVAFLLTCVALVACWLPAHRASRIAPTDALRTE
ncbi:MAG TPA: ABC transporter permease [Candidatus Limnocylindrales bacterium]|nr:ABC transporter permease [Candidatus Limnocylindrales bacterium]